MPEAVLAGPGYGNFVGNARAKGVTQSIGFAEVELEKGRAWRTGSLAPRPPHGSVSACCVRAGALTADRREPLRECSPWRTIPGQLTTGGFVGSSSGERFLPYGEVACQPDEVLGPCSVWSFMQPAIDRERFHDRLIASVPSAG